MPREKEAVRSIIVKPDTKEIKKRSKNSNYAILLKEYHVRHLDPRVPSQLHFRFPVCFRYYWSGRIMEAIRDPTRKITANYELLGELTMFYAIKTLTPTFRQRT